MALTCPAGFYFDSRTNGCRSCEYVCGDEYGGRETDECTETCPGYGISTTVAPADKSNLVMWILSSFGLAIILIGAAVFIFCCIKRKRCLRQPPKTPIVREESKEGLVGKSVFCTDTK